MQHNEFNVTKSSNDVLPEANNSKKFSYLLLCVFDIAFHSKSFAMARSRG